MLRVPTKKLEERLKKIRNNFQKMVELILENLKNILRIKKLILQTFEEIYSYLKDFWNSGKIM